MAGIKAVVFDLGKVLLDFDYSRAARNLEQCCRIRWDEIQRLLDQSPLLYRYETNQIDTAEFFAQVREFSGYEGDQEQFAACFGDIFSEIGPMVALHGELRSCGVPTYVFSNTNELAVRHIREKFPFFSGFDGYVLSFEHGAMKPDPALYEVLERLTGYTGEQLLYLDDRLENVEAGRARGWQVIWHQTPALSLETVRKSGLLA